MENDGLIEVENPSEMLLSRRPADAPGTCVTCVMEGARPVLAEIQALLASSSYPTPRRTSNGFDYNRAAMLLAVLEKRGQLKVSQCDAYLNIIGGLTLDEPGRRPCRNFSAGIELSRQAHRQHRVAAIGEVGLTGELRNENNLPQRLSRGAAARLHGVHHSKAAWEPSWTSGRPEADGRCRMSVKRCVCWRGRNAADRGARGYSVRRRCCGTTPPQAVEYLKPQRPPDWNTQLA